MKRYIFILTILTFVIACNTRQDNSKKNIALTDTSNISKNSIYIDSLDLDSTSYITSNFPDAVRNILYSISDSLWGFIEKSSYLNDKKHNELSDDSLSKMLRQQGFEISDSQREIIANKKYFNKRELINWYNTKTDTITTQVIYWHLGKKYILIRQRWNE